VAIKLFGFTLGEKDIVQKENPEQASFALPTEALDDGAVTITQNAHYGTYVDLEGAVRNELELITRYREMSNHPECDMAITEIVDEAISHDDKGKVVDIVLDELKQPESIKKKIREEFDNVLSMLNFSNLADDIFRRWYIDGRIYFHIIVNEKNAKEGIQELRYIDPRKIRKVREVQKGRDLKTGADIIKSMAEYYVYNDKGTTAQNYTASVNSGLRIAPEAIVNVNSGMMDAKNTFVISYLHKAIKPLNQLRMIEDAIVIYRVSRAPERRVFYIDFWLPRREGGKGTEITTLPAGQNLGQMEDVQYFQKKLLQSLNVPYSRLEPQGGGMVGLGRTTEVTRDELKFNKFVVKLRNKFSQIFDHALKIQLSLKGICSQEEWETFREDIFYDYRKDNNFTELRDAELLSQRLQTLGQIDPYVGRYYSQEWVKKNVLHLTDDEVEEMQKQIDSEPAPPEPGQDGQPMQQDMQQQDQATPEQFPPEDNVTETGSAESPTPELDSVVKRFGRVINR